MPHLLTLWSATHSCFNSGTVADNGGRDIVYLVVLQFLLIQFQ